jgi:membrane protein insertase Oxa1/YidC/SpoIIIJ
MGASMYLQQATTPTTGDEAQRRIMLMMPIVFTVMFVIFPFPAGLVLYWLVNNVISIIQQVYLRTDKRVTPLQATVVSSVLIFCFGWMLTLIG